MVSADRILITLRGGAPWGFRLSGGGGLPLIINKIRKKSQAHVQGLKEGDAVISINGVHVHDKTQDEALELVEAAGDSLSLEIYRGDIDDLSVNKHKKTIQISSSSGSNLSGTLRLVTTSDDGVSPGDVILIPSGDSVTSDSRETNHYGGVRLAAKGDSRRSVTLPVISVDSSTVRTVNVPVRDRRSTSKTSSLDKSSISSSDVGIRDVHSATSQYTVAAKPFFVSQATSSDSSYPPQNPPQHPQPPPQVSPQTHTQVVAQVQQVYNLQPSLNYIPQPPHTSYAPPLSPQSPRSQYPPPVSPKPKRILISQPPSVSIKPPGLTSSVTSSTFDDGKVHREVTREQHVHSSDDGTSTTFVQREKTTTTTGRPSFVKNQTSAFNAVQPSDAATTTHRPLHRSTTTSRKSTTNIINQKGPTPFISSGPSTILQSQFQTQTAPTPRSIDNQTFNNDAPLFKPTKFVPSNSKKDIQGLYTPTSPMVDFNVHSGYNDGKENMSPQPMFQVKSITTEKSKSQDVWRPNMWLPDQPPSTTQQLSQVTTPKEGEPAYVFQNKPGYSLVEEQKRKLMAFQTQTPKYEYENIYGQENKNDIDRGHEKHGRLHVFAPPVEIHAVQDAPYSPYEDQYHMDEYEDGLSSPDSSGVRRKKKLYSDSAFYDTPGRSYPTITEQMKLCKTIAQSLTSAANRRARGAKMFMKRKRKSSKWIHEGHSELSSSAGDVANLQELDSELAPDDGGNKPLMYFKIPSLKHRLGNESKSTKMSLTQEEFEKLRLNSKKCDHTSLPPDPCFDIVADLKAHKGRGGRLFERRRQRSDKFVIDETNAKFSQPHANFDNKAAQDGDRHLTPREIALKHGWKGDPSNIQALTKPLVKSSLKSDESPCLLKGANFNRTAKGWSGGGEYPIAESHRSISVTRDFGNSTATLPTSLPEQQYYNKVSAWQAAGESPSVPSHFQSLPRDQQEYRQPRTHDDLRGQGLMEQRPSDYRSPRPKSWQAESYDIQRQRGAQDQTFASPNYRQGTGAYPAVAYKQPIIPGTDL
uniref:PDZ domain-containing protein n=1 Tax=Arion vulgaris TaxID=1028688 RepID=A0A0B7B449_9EUPU